MARPFLITVLPFVFAAKVHFAAETSTTNDVGNDWKMATNSQEVTVYSRTRSGSKLKEFEAVGEIDASSRAVHAVIDDLDGYPSFIPYVTECRLIRREGIEVLHARSHIPMAMALMAQRWSECKLIFDIRGFMPEEYTDADPDWVGDAMTSTAFRSVTVSDDDTALPVIDLTGSQGSQNDGQNQVFTWDISDASGLASFSVVITQDGNVIQTSSAANGSFKALTGKSPQAQGNDDDKVGDAYNTGIFALILQLDSGNLRFLGAKKKKSE